MISADQALSAPKLEAVRVWCCPRCHGTLFHDADTVYCGDCRHVYECIDGIPDLRVPSDSWIDFAKDSQLARELVSLDLDLEGIVYEMYSRRPNWDEERIRLRTRQVLAAPDRLLDDINGWLQQAISDGTYLDLGCGAGGLISAASRHGCKGVGLDVSMAWLVIAKRMIAFHGGDPVLAAGVGEWLPLRDGQLSGVVSLDVIEHVRDPDRYLREIDRVVGAGGRIALSTPNRFSLTSEPHVFVWGVGWLPRSLQAPYVRWRSGKDYDDTVLMSSFDLCRRINRNTNFQVVLDLPPVPQIEIDRFPKTKARLARIYNQVRYWRILRAALVTVGPFFQIVGAKRVTLSETRLQRRST